MLGEKVKSASRPATEQPAPTSTSDQPALPLTAQQTALPLAAEQLHSCQQCLYFRRTVTLTDKSVY